MAAKALVLIDLQNDYFPGGRFALSGTEEAGVQAGRLLAAARAAGHAVIHIQHVAEAADAPFFVKGTAGAEIHDTLRPIEGEPVIVKHKANSFLNTVLKQRLDERHIREIVIAGAMSHMCVDAGTRAASDLGYSVTVAHDACATRDLTFGDRTVAAADVHAAFMAALAFGYARVVSTDEVLAELAA